jgi:hypothetical protein
VEALEDPVEGVDLEIREVSDDRRARVEVQVAADLPPRVGHARAQEEGRRADGPAGDHHHVGVHPHVPARLPVGSQQDALDTRGPGAIVDHPVDPGLRLDPGAGLRREGEPGQRGGLLGVVGAADGAEPRPVAIEGVPLEAVPLPTERQRASAEEPVVQVELVRADPGDVQHLPDPVEARRHRRRRQILDPLAGPEIEEPIRGAEADQVVHHRTPSDHAAVQDGDALVRGRAGTPLLVEEPHHLALSLGEVRGRDVRAFLEHDHVVSGLRQHGRGGGAPGPGAHDHHAGLQGEVSRDRGAGDDHRFTSTGYRGGFTGRSKRESQGPW